MASPIDHGDLQGIVDALDIAVDVTRSSEALADFTSSGPITAAADPSLADIVAALNSATGGTGSEVQAGKAPMPQNVGILPPYDEGSAGQNYLHLVEMSSIVSLYTAIWNANARTQRGHPQPYNITNAQEAALAFADMADSAYNVMVGPLAGLYNFSSGVQTTFHKDMSKTSIHLEFLGELFKGFSLSKPAILQLDGILTNFVSSLGTINIETGRTNNTVDQTLRINQVMRLNISGDEANPIWVFQPRTRIVYMHIDGSTWHWATNKVEHTSNTFNMRYVVVDCDLNVNKYLASKNNLNSVFQTVSGKSLEEYGKMINPNPVRSNA
ncbi:hypothetical protein E0Z10_g8496 [Xylaria hypoxylon]|uniref:Uncharacterized protein n=1 Tax=Xylaria hypoxylon TaxID=37992 RepID=A0A4Z0Y7Z5_9PEZI|nr:hypothetical protein E0Z10_g8496 [Xylaria hypoxylon]